MTRCGAWTRWRRPTPRARPVRRHPGHDALKSMTEGPRLADAGAAEHRMARLTERWIEVQTASRAYEGVVAAAWMTANRTFAGRLQERFNAGEAMQPRRRAQALARHRQRDVAGDAALRRRSSSRSGSCCAAGWTSCSRSARSSRTSSSPRASPRGPRSTRSIARSTSSSAGCGGSSGSAADDPAAHGRPGGDARRGGGAEPEDRLRHAAAGGDQGRRGRDRDHAEGRGVPHRQGDALSLPAAGRATGGDAGADRLQPDRPPHDDRPPGGPLAGPQPPRSGHRPVGRRLGQSRAAPIAG